jgi:hypothetical protein
MEMPLQALNFKIPAYIVFKIASESVQNFIDKINISCIETSVLLPITIDLHNSCCASSQEL